MQGRDRPTAPSVIASYHSSATARDRDRLRQAHLQRLGWRFHRIWSTDGFFDRETEIERLVASFEDAVRHADREEAGGAGDRGAVASRATVASSAGEARSGRPARGPRPQLSSRENIEEYTDRELRSLAEWVVSDGLLRTEGEMVREMFALLPLQRLGVRIRARLGRVAASIARMSSRGA